MQDAQMMQLALRYRTEAEAWREIAQVALAMLAEREVEIKAQARTIAAQRDQLRHQTGGRE